MHYIFYTGKVRKTAYKVVSSEGWIGKQKTVTLVKTAVISSDNNMNLQAEKRKGQMKHNEAIKNKENVKFMTYFNN